MLSSGGVRVLLPRAALGVARPGQWLPKAERYYVWRLGGRDFLVLWKPFKGLCVLSSEPVGSPGLAGRVQFVNLESAKMKKLAMGMGDDDKLPPLSSDSVVFKKFPRLCEFLTATSYDDGSARAPGRLWLDNDGIAFTVTLFEPSCFKRVRLRGNTLDDAVALAERHLGMDGAPWEADQYARDKAGKKKGK